MLLVSIPHVMPNPGIFAARVRHVQKSQYTGYSCGLFVLPAFHERFSQTDELSFENERIDVPLEKAEIEAIRKISGSDDLMSPVIEGICRFWNDLNPKIVSSITSFGELTEYLKTEIKKRT